MHPRNLAQLHRLQADCLGDRTAVRYKRHGVYHDLNWRRYHADAQACAASLVAAGIRPGDRVALLAENRVEWLLADMGILAAAAVNVPPHAPLSARQVQYQLTDSGARWLFLSTPEQADKIRTIRRELPNLLGVVAFDAAAVGDGVLSWDGFLQRGRLLLDDLASELRRREEQVAPDDLATVMYTSGTTGNPKGVMLTHHNLLTNAEAMSAASPLPPDAVVLCWLPFSHIYARTVDHYRTLASGTLLVLAESPDTLVQNLSEVEPTHISSVPRFYEKVLAAASASDPAETGRRLRRIFGRRIAWLNSGGAPLPLPVAKAYQDAGLLVLQGYGLTESSPVISFNRPDRYRLESVGLPLPGVEVRIASDGEVLTRGPHVMPGYWNNPTATAEAIHDGWLHTGDLGSLDSDGFLTITGRKKELLVLSNGKKVVPSFLEGLMIADPCLDQAVVCGEGRNFLTALIVPNWSNVRKELPCCGDLSPEALAVRREVCDFIQQRVAECLRDVANWEKVQKIVVLPQPLSVAADELTVSLKLRRQFVVAKYGECIERLYQA